MCDTELIYVKEKLFPVENAPVELQTRPFHEVAELFYNLV